MRTFLISILLIAAALSAGYGVGVYRRTPEDQQQINFREMLTECKSKSLFSTDRKCLTQYLQSHRDYSCDNSLCCGGNSIGWYQCF